MTGVTAIRKEHPKMEPYPPFPLHFPPEEKR